MTKPEKISEFTGDAAEAKRSVLSAKPGGRTALIATVYLGLSGMRKAWGPRRVLLVLSDGMDNRSRYSKNDLMGIALEADVQIYTIIVDSAPAHKKPIEQTEERRGRYLLEERAQGT